MKIGVSVGWGVVGIGDGREFDLGVKGEVGSVDYNIVSKGSKDEFSVGFYGSVYCML